MADAMLTRSLFAKIFLWFWLAMTLVAGSAILAAFYTHARPDISRPPFRGYFGNIVAARGQEALDALERGGPEAVREYLDRWERVTGRPAFLVAEDGRETTGRPLPPGADSVVRTAIEQKETQLDRARGRHLIATPLTGEDGARYVVLREIGRGRSGPHGPRRFHEAMHSLGPRRAPMPPHPLGLLWSDPYTLATMLGAVLATGGVLCYGLARYLTGPVRVLRTATTSLAQGDFTVRAGPRVSNRRDEIGQLGRDFDRMAERIESVLSAERRLLRDISHELRSPLARLNVALGIARQKAGADTCPLLDRIETESERLDGLIEQLLSLARIESGAATMPAEAFDLASVIEDVVRDADFEARSRKRAVAIIERSPATISGTPHLLRSAIENIVRNGVRHTAEGTEVEVSLRNQDGVSDPGVLVTVRDHGPGVPEESLGDLFRPFYRVGEDRNRKTGGVGLGLAIADRAIRLHGGSVHAANAAGGGLLVEIRLPAAPGSCRAHQRPSASSHSGGQRPNP